MAGRDFEGFVVVVTGASTGLGRSIAVQTAEQGAEVVVINYARSAEEAQETARQVEARGAKAVLVQGDVASDEDCRKIAAAAQAFGRIDALFNNAGTTTFAAHGDMDVKNSQNGTPIVSRKAAHSILLVRNSRRRSRAC